MICTSNVYVPGGVGVVGVPDNTPPELNVSPGGSGKLGFVACQESAVTLPLLCRATLYADPLVRAGTAVVVITACDPTPIKNCRESDWPVESDTVIVKVSP